MTGRSLRGACFLAVRIFGRDTRYATGLDWTWEEKTLIFDAVEDEFVNKQKEKQLLNLLGRGVVMVHLVPGRSGVAVPPQYAEDPVLRLNIAYGFNLPALQVDADGVYAVLSFNRQNFGCTLPWDSIFAMTLPDDGHEGVVWPASAPEELRSSFGKTGAVVAIKPPAAEDQDGATEESAPKPAPSDGRPGLRLVK